MNLQAFDEPGDRSGTGQQGRHDHHGPALSSDAGGVIQARKQAGSDQESGKPIHQRDGQLTGTEEDHEREESQLPALHLDRPRLLDKPEGYQRREQQHPAHVEGQRKLADAPFDGCLPGMARECCAFKCD